MSAVTGLIDSVLAKRFGVDVNEARWLGKVDEWLIKIHGSWLKIDVTGQGFGDMVVLTVLLGNPPSSHLAEFHELLLEKNLELPGPSLWVRELLFGLREARYTDGLQDIELVDMIELIIEVARETKEELAEIYDDSLSFFDIGREDDLKHAIMEIGAGL